MTELLLSPEAWISFATLTSLEIVLGIDNIVFIAILAGRLPRERQLGGRRMGLALALISRLALLASLSYMAQLDQSLFIVFGHGVSGRDLILFGGGLFLLSKATYEIYDQVEAAESGVGTVGDQGEVSFVLIMVQIMLIDVVFSLDSVITAVGMVQDLRIMIAAVLIATAIMMIFAGPVGDFVQRHPSVKILALSFLVMIGVLLVAEALHHHLNRGFVYFGMGFSLSIELLNIRYRTRFARLNKPAATLPQGM